eukprot:TRINITY_DN9537_c0_g1_i1.p1 TRINITY_DN9537_c0_g1~~TRINITY_DN9537_c0_g1_i1.p1  ORF type:complete len:120 (+),score=16.48 TRINITY_DN9537_c0_g1_i1:361-720(+)
MNDVIAQVKTSAPNLKSNKVDGRRQRMNKRDSISNPPLLSWENQISLLIFLYIEGLRQLERIKSTIFAKRRSLIAETVDLCFVRRANHVFKRFTMENKLSDKVGCVDCVAAKGGAVFYL